MIIIINTKESEYFMLRLLTKWPKSRQKFYYYLSVSLHFFILFIYCFFPRLFSFIACQFFSEALAFFPLFIPRFYHSPSASTYHIRDLIPNQRAQPQSALHNHFFRRVAMKKAHLCLYIQRADLQFFREKKSLFYHYQFFAHYLKYIEMSVHKGLFFFTLCYSLEFFWS